VDNHTVVVQYDIGFRRHADHLPLSDEWLGNSCGRIWQPMLGLVLTGAGRCPVYQRRTGSGCRGGYGFVHGAAAG
jgi:hypothetical protein